MNQEIAIENLKQLTALTLEQVTPITIIGGKGKTFISLLYSTLMELDYARNCKRCC
jgi:hypothetical protein